MASLGFAFDANNVAPAEEFQPLPPGDYQVHIVASEIKTSSGGTSFLSLQFEVVEGEHSGRRLFHSLFLFSENSDVAQRQLSAICHAIGQLNVSDSDQLHFQPLIASVKFIPAGHVRQGKNGRADYTYEKATNEISGFKMLAHSAQMAAQPQRPVAPPAPAVTAAYAAQAARPAITAPGGRAAGAPPWERARA